MKRYIYIPTILISALWVGCTAVEEPSVSAELQPYFDLFTAEAAERGVTIDLAAMQISGVLTDIESNSTVGQCQSLSNGGRQINLDRQYWSQLSAMDREYLVFHELGHCALGRDHLNDRDRRGRCISMMQSGEGTCIKVYNRRNRAAYLDELFSN